MSQSSTEARPLLVFGTRPECLKLASLYHALKLQPDCSPIVMNSGQHRAVVCRLLAQLNVPCDIDNAALSSSSLFDGVAKLKASICRGAVRAGTNILVAQGDTSTAYATALAAREIGIPVAHVEAGLRTNHPYHPFPEEYFRRKIGRIASLHFAPTRSAVENLLCEGVAPSRIVRSGNTIVDQLRDALEHPSPLLLPVFIRPAHRIITLTLHRRENLGEGIRQTGEAIRRLMQVHDNLITVCVLPPNPIVSTQLTQQLAGHDCVHLIAPLCYRSFIALLKRSALIISDSGGIQEEAPYIGVPLLVVRRNTERVEEAALGHATLVDAIASAIYNNAERLLHAKPPDAIPFSDAAPSGEGYAGRCIALHLAQYARSMLLDIHRRPVYAH